VPGGVEAVVIGTRRETAQATMRECVELGIGQVWMHRGPAPAAFHPRPPRMAGNTESP
jgi:uncharacterized protein